MVNIVLMCAGGMSTSVLVRKIRAAAEEEGFECEVNAYSVGEARKVGPGASWCLSALRCPIWPIACASSAATCPLR